MWTGTMMWSPAYLDYLEAVISASNVNTHTTRLVRLSWFPGSIEVSGTRNRTHPLTFKRSWSVTANQMYSFWKRAAWPLKHHFKTFLALTPSQWRSRLPQCRFSNEQNDRGNFSQWALDGVAWQHESISCCNGVVLLGGRAVEKGWTFNHEWGRSNGRRAEGTGISWRTLHHLSWPNPTCQKPGGVLGSKDSLSHGWIWCIHQHSVQVSRMLFPWLWNLLSKPWQNPLPTHWGNNERCTSMHTEKNGPSLKTSVCCERNVGMQMEANKARTRRGGWFCLKPQLPATVTASKCLLWWPYKCNQAVPSNSRARRNPLCGFHEPLSIRKQNKILPKWPSHLH